MNRVFGILVLVLVVLTAAVVESRMEIAPARRANRIASGASAGQTQIAQATGTKFGNTTPAGDTLKLANAWDSNEVQSYDNSFYTPSARNRIWTGKDWGSGNTKTVTGFVAIGSTDGFCGTSTGAVNINATLYGNNTFPTSGTTGKQLAFATGSDAASLQLSNMSAISTTAYRYHWVLIKGASGDNIDICEVKLYEN